ncbi:hypothetical protein DSO57_1010323 [Entomophthora muscae]|uniref:Uncharacterized protein n=1 Tax=Entomophthora muscae TaxID=34485 RepID=A0ACC2SVT6_9FUNG|nr:hypothetical protein DSO57_1010323 [Entomophthora muscae]
MLSYRVFTIALAVLASALPLGAKVELAEESLQAPYGEQTLEYGSQLELVNDSLKHSSSLDQGNRPRIPSANLPTDQIEEELDDPTLDPTVLGAATEVFRDPEVAPAATKSPNSLEAAMGKLRHMIDALSTIYRSASKFVEKP